ncbi:FadR/GntR family transcriptional regulator [Macrococcus sp. EM39E]|uniref:FadR/GntR family transcriptional regulator n=1 Tax=Macrococcus animalis TaxID=3395467 RepID=UPI0039BE7E77
MFSPLKKLSMSEEIFNQLKESIEHKQYKLGDKLPTEKELCEMFNVSRQPVREALNSLKATGFIESKQGEGSFVTYDEHHTTMFFDLDNLTKEDYFDLVELRHVLEVQASGLCAVRHNDKDIDKIYSSLKVIKNEMSDYESIGFEADYLFHQAIIEGSKNKYIIETFNNISDIYKIGMKFSLSLNIGNHQKRSSVIKEHEEIYQAIKDRNVEEAQSKMNNHILNLRKKMGDKRII